MKTLLKFFTVIVAALLFMGSPVICQTPTNEMANTTTTTDVVRHDDYSKWGLLGLIGLVGLVGLRKNEKVNTYTTSNTPKNR